jgi:hypothetical protein
MTDDGVGKARQFNGSNSSMHSGPGYWLAPDTGSVYQVETTHDSWLLASANQQTVGLTPSESRVLNSLDPQRDFDEIRMVGVWAGLIRIRDRHRNLTFQFDAPPSRVQAVLRAIAESLPKLFNGVEHFMLLHNLHDDAHAAIWTTEFLRKLDSGEPVLTARKKPIPENDTLRQRMDRLLKTGPAEK